jgi:predicted enzyme related to lactoylglutathione lyase
MMTRISLIVGTVLLCLSPSQAASEIRFPSIGEGESPSWYPGKVVWHDLFTAMPDEAAGFYSAVFGWEGKAHILNGRKVYLMRSNGYPMAGIIERQRVEGEKEGGIWVAYASVFSIDKAVKTSINGGGSILVGKGYFPGRGYHAICKDPQGAIYGLIRLDAGDPGEYFPNVGDFMWAQHFSADPETASTFYDLIGQIEVIEDTRLRSAKLYLLSSGGYARAGIGPLPREADPDQSDWIHFIRVESISETLEKVAPAGGKTVVAPQEDLMGGRLAILTDPSGALVGIMEAETPASSQLAEAEVSQ